MYHTSYHLQRTELEGGETKANKAQMLPQVDHNQEGKRAITLHVGSSLWDRGSQRREASQGRLPRVGESCSLEVPRVLR